MSLLSAEGVYWGLPTGHVSYWKQNRSSESYTRPCGIYPIADVSLRGSEFGVTLIGLVVNESYNKKLPPQRSSRGFRQLNTLPQPSTNDDIQRFRLLDCDGIFNFTVYVISYNISYPSNVASISLPHHTL